MSNYRPITDVWILARPKVKYYGAYPAGFLGRARALLGVAGREPVLHLCSGKVRDYPYDGIIEDDVTVDADASLEPDYTCDITDIEQWNNILGMLKENEGICAVLADPPYTEADAAHYTFTGAMPSARLCLERGLDVLQVGDRMGILHYRSPRPPKNVKLVAAIAVWLGYEMQWRGYTVYEKR